MIRFAIFLTLLTFVGYRILPKWSAEISRPFFEQCLKTTPRVHHESEIQSLVCGSNLQRSRSSSTHHVGGDDSPATDATRVINSWRNLGLIHILVVSGGHLTILAALLSFIGLRRGGRRPCEKIRAFGVGLVVLLNILLNKQNGESSFPTKPRC